MGESYLQAPAQAAATEGDEEIGRDVPDGERAEVQIDETKFSMNNTMKELKNACSQHGLATSGSKF